jgi:MOSC domain-containing protein YiiM
MSTQQLLAVCRGSITQLTQTTKQPTDGMPELIATAIRKSICSSIKNPQAIAVSEQGIDGDQQADLRVHGGPDKAVYLYPSEHYPFWDTICQQAGRITTQHSEQLPWGSVGENLCVRGLLETQLWVGDRIHLGSCEFIVTAPRSPCFKFNLHMGFNWASKMMWQSGFTGAYLRVVRPGIVTAGDFFTLTPGDRNITLTQSHALRRQRME